MWNISELLIRRIMDSLGVCVDWFAIFAVYVYVVGFAFFVFRCVAFVLLYVVLNQLSKKSIFRLLTHSINFSFKKLFKITYSENHQYTNALVQMKSELNNYSD